MTLYLDTSALLKRYIDEPDLELAVELLSSDPELRQTQVARSLGLVVDES